MAELEKARSHNGIYDAALTALQQELAAHHDMELKARRVMEKLALCWQAATLIVYGERLIADAFILSRLAGDRYQQYGCLPTGIDCEAIIKRAMPKVKA